MAPLKFNPTVARVERGRYIVEGPLIVSNQNSIGKGWARNRNLENGAGICYYDEALFVKTLRTGQVGTTRNRRISQNKR